MELPLLIVLAFAGLGATQTIDNCPGTLPRDEYLKLFGGFCFEFVVFRQRAYSVANADCTSHGGSLALVKSQEITDFIVDQLLYEYGFGTKVWIGLSDTTTEGTFLWEDGSPLDYTNWAPGKGNVTNNYEDCVTLIPSQQGRWDDDACEDGVFVNHRFPYICQYRIRVPPTTATTSAS